MTGAAGADRAAPRRAYAYHAFISYSRAADGKLAPALQRGLQRFAKPWYRLRALRVFRDDASLSANPNLWGSIERALEGSAFFILLASPNSAQSRWVGEEARWWLEHRGTDELLIVLTDGELLWGPAGPDPEHTSALPGPLRGAFATEPRYVDMRWARSEEHLAARDARFRSALADLAAPLHGRSKDDMLGEDVRQHRRTLAVAWTAGLTVAALAVAAAVLAVLAVAARNTAETEARIALSRLLAGQSASELEQKPQVAALLALESFRLVSDDTPERAFDARDAMLRVLERSPRTIGVLHTGVSGNAVASSPDGKTLAVAGVNDTVQLWDAVRRRQLGRMRTGEAVALAFGSEGTTLAAVVQRESDYALTLWDVARRTAIGRPVHVASNLAVYAFGDDGETLAVVDDDVLTVWSTRRRERLAPPLRVGGDEIVTSVALSGDRQVAAVGHGDGVIGLWDLGRRALDGEPLRGSLSVDHIVFNPRGGTLATVESPDLGDQVVVRLWDVGRRRPLGGPLRRGGSTFGLAFSRDGTMLAGSGGRDVQLWDGRRPRHLGTLVGHIGSTSAAFAADGTLVSAGDDATVRLWDVGRAEPLGRPLPAPPAELRDIAFAPDGTRMAAIDFDGALTMHELAPAGRSRRFAGRFASAAFSPDASMLASGGENGIVRVWSVSGGELVATLPVRLGPNPDLSTFEPEEVPAWDKGLDPVWSVAFSADGAMLAAGGRAGTVVRWDTDRWRPEGGPVDGRAAARSLAFSADGSMLAGAGADVKVWAARGRSGDATRLRYGGDDLSRADVAFSPDRDLLAAGGREGIRLWRTSSWESLGRALGAGGDEVRRLAFSRDGATLVAVDGALRLWDPRRQRALGGPLRGRSGAELVALSVGADGRTLVTGAVDGSVVAWDPILLGRDYDAWQERLCRLAGRNLTRLEWAQFVPARPYERSCPGFP